MPFFPRGSELSPGNGSEVRVAGQGLPFWSPGTRRPRMLTWEQGPGCGPGWLRSMWEPTLDQRATQRCCQVGVL